MVFRMQRNDGLGAAPKGSDRDAARDAKKKETNEHRRVIQAAEDEWKRYVNSLTNLVSQLRNGSLPSSYPLPAPPASDRTLVPHLARQADQILQKQVPTAYNIAEKLDQAKGARDAASSYAAGQPPVSPGGGLVRQPLPVNRDLPQQVQQAVTVAAGSAPVLRQVPTGADVGLYETPVDANQPSGGGGMSPRTRNLLILAGVGLTGWLLYRLFRKGRK